jgi:hypothetical protein
MPAPSDIHFGLGKREKPDAVRVIWTSGVVQAEVEFPARKRTRRKTFRAAQNRRTRPQTVVVSVSLHLERRAIRIYYRFSWRRRDGQLAGSGAFIITPIPTNLCELRPTKLKAEKRQIRNSRDERTGRSFVSRSFKTRRRRTRRGRRSLSE